MQTQEMRKANSLFFNCNFNIMGLHGFHKYWRGVGMKHRKRITAAFGAAILLAALCIGVRLHSMKPSTFTLKSRRHGIPVDQPRYKSEIVWVKTSDGMILEVPQWQIDQSKVLQVMFVHQKGGNSKDNPVNASMITSKQLELLQEALQKASNLEIFRKFYASLSGVQQKSLLVDAFTLEMQGLASLIISYMFPIEVQQQMGAAALQQAGIIDPVIQYLKKNSEQIPVYHKGPIVSVALSSDGNRMISGAAGIDHNLILYDLKAHKPIKDLVLNTFPQPCVAFSPDGQYVIAGALRFVDNLILWDGVTGEEIRIVATAGSMVECVAYSPDGKYIVSGSSDKNLILWDIRTGKKIKTFKGHTAVIKCVAYSPDGDYIVSGSSDNNVILWNSSGKQIKILEGHKERVNCIVYSSNGKNVVSGSSDNLILWNVETGKQIKVLKGHTGAVECVAYSPNGKYIVSGSRDGNLILWNAQDGQQINIFEGHAGAILCVAYNPDGQYVVAGRQDGTLFLWKLVDEQVLNLIATSLNLAQARLLYRLYLAKINNVPVIMDRKDLDYQLYLTLPINVQKVVKSFLPFELLFDVTEKMIQEKMNEYRLSLFYDYSYVFGKSEKKHDKKVKAVKDAMQKFDTNSIEYKACERLLIELEQKAAFSGIMEIKK
jgi:hypothetical protein